jgi:hypothetical protein
VVFANKAFLDFFDPSSDVVCGNAFEAIHREGTTAPTMWCHFGQYSEHRSLGLPFEGDSGCGKDSKYLKGKKIDRSRMAGRTGFEPEHKQ